LEFGSLDGVINTLCYHQLEGHQGHYMGAVLLGMINIFCCEWKCQKMCAHHVKFVARTVLVRNNDVDAAYRALDRLTDNFIRPLLCGHLTSPVQGSHLLWLSNPYWIHNAAY